MHTLPEGLIQFLKFAMVGVSGTLITLTTQLFLVEIGIIGLTSLTQDLYSLLFPILLVMAMVVAWIPGTVTNFTLNRWITFGKPPGNIFGQFSKYWLSTLVAMLSWQLTTFILTYVVQLHWFLASILAIAVSTLVGFGMAKWFTFRKNNAQEGETTALKSNVHPITIPTGSTEEQG